jgi:uncharacterized protein (DUF58 family)
VKWTGNRTFRFTREGKVFLALTLGAGLAAVNTGNNLLYLVLGLMLSTLVVSGILSEQALRGVRLRRRPPRRAFEGEPCLVEIALENRKRRLPSHSLAVRAVGGKGPALVHFLKVRPGEEVVRAHRFVPPRRGPVELGDLHLFTRFPFGLVEKGRKVATGDTLLAYPGLVPVADAPPAAAADRTESASDGIGSGSEVAGIREYRAGDEARVIHWGRTASLGRMVVRERHRDAVARLVLHVDPSGSDADATWREAFEQSLRLAGSQAVRALSHGTPVEVRTPTGRSPVLRPGSPPDPILRFLALLEPSE